MAISWPDLLRAEATLTASVVAGLALGELVLASGAADRIFRPLLPRLRTWRVPPRAAQALALALGSPRAGAGLLASGYAQGDLSREETVFGALCLAFPGYLRRWITTASLAAGLAGGTGLLYALVLLGRSAVRFLWLLGLLRRHGTPRDEAPVAVLPPSGTERRRRLLRALLVSLPWAWTFFALTYALMPSFEALLLEHLGHTALLPPAGWTVAAAALAHATASLAAAGGALASGELSTAQALLALLLGNAIGTFTRVLRQNVGYWLGIFPRELLRPLLAWHLGTLLPLEGITLLAAAAAVRAGF